MRCSIAVNTEKAKSPRGGKEHNKKKKKQGSKQKERRMATQETQNAKTVFKQT